MVSSVIYVNMECQMLRTFVVFAVVVGSDLDIPNVQCCLSKMVLVLVT